MSDGTPKGYAFINFKGNTYTIDYKVVDKPADYQIEISAPKIVEHKKKTSASIYANFFMGSATDTVMCRIDNGKWAVMNYVLDYAPEYTDVLYKWDNTNELLSGRRPSNPNMCMHLWRTSVPVNLAPGEHTIEVKAKDMFGREFTQKSSYKIASATKN